MPLYLRMVGAAIQVSPPLRWRWKVIFVFICHLFEVKLIQQGQLAGDALISSYGWGCHLVLPSLEMEHITPGTNNCAEKYSHLVALLLKHEVLQRQKLLCTLFTLEKVIPFSGLHVIGRQRKGRRRLRKLRSYLHYLQLAFFGYSFVIISWLIERVEEEIPNRQRTYKYAFLQVKIGLCLPFFKGSSRNF